MIDWAEVLQNSIWLAGLAIIFSVFSLASYNAGGQRPGPRMPWAAFAGSAWTLAGVILFCLGMTFTAGSWLEAVLWTMLVPAAATLWALNKRTVSAAIHPHDGERHAGQVAAQGDKDLAGRGASPRPLAERIVRLEPLWLLLLSPFFLFPGTGGPAIVATAALPAIWVARRMSRGRFVPATPLDWPICVMMVMLMVSLFVTFDPALSLDKVTGLLLGIGVYYALIELLSSGDRLRWAVTGYAGAGFLLALVGLLGTDWTGKFTFLAGVVGKLPSILKGLPGAENGINPNETAGALLWVLPVQVAMVGLWRAESRRWRVAGRVAAAVMAVVSGGVLLLAESRAALAAMAAGLLLLLWAVLPRTRLVGIAAGVLAIIAVGAILYMGPGNIADNVFSGSVNFGLEGSIRSSQSRMEIWSRALYGIQDFPLTGMGMNTFRRLAPELYPSSYPPSTDLAHAHNQLLQAALDLGLPGLVAYVALWLVCVTLLVALWRWSKGGRIRWLAGGIGGALAAYALFGMVDTVALGAKPGVFFWGLIALLVAAWQREEAAAEARSQPAVREQTAVAALTGEYEAVMIE